MHMITLHQHGSSNPLGISSNADKIPMHPYYLFKDLVTIFLFFLLLALFVFYMPNALGHSDNYIPANPMQTPPSINYLTQPAYLSTLLGIVGLSSLPSMVRANSSVASAIKGSTGDNTAMFAIGNSFVTMTKSELESLIHTQFQAVALELTQKPLSPEDFTSFQQLANGIFQAEGHWGGYVTDHVKLMFRPLFYISQNAGDQSLAFFAKLNAVLPGVFTYQLSITQGGYWHLRLLCRSWDHLISAVMPYFSLVYGEKFTGMAKLRDILELQGAVTIQARTHFVWLVYNLTTAANAIRKVSFNTYLATVNAALEALPLPLPNYAEKYPENTQPVSFMFILGFFLGDGNLYFRIRDAGSSLWFIPIFRITQISTPANKHLMHLIADCLKSVGLNVIVYFEGIYVGIKAEGINSFSTNFISMLGSLSSYFYWKTEQLTLLLRIIKLMSIKPKGWLEAQLAILNTIYASVHDRTYPLSHWTDRLINIFADNTRDLPAGTSYITLVMFKKGPNLGKPQSWMVKLPAGLNHKPKEKHFALSTYGTSEKALAAAIQYRNSTLAKYLQDLGY